MATSTLDTVYETLLTVPGMHDSVKIDFKIPRKTVLILAEVISRGMNQTTALENGILSISKESAEELNTIIKESLEKAGLTDLHHKLSLLQME